MSLKINESEKEEILITSQASVNKSIANRNDKIDTAPLITSKIGKGEDAKNSIIWTIITWSLSIPTGITILYFVTMWGIYILNLNYAIEVKNIREDILKIWGIFIPVITLTLGYIYGKSVKENENSEGK